MKSNSNLGKTLDEILPLVENPVRYVGNELNSVYKGVRDETIRFALAFPDVYEVGMSHLGIKILYHMLNEQDDVYCERVFAPWIDMEHLMREKSTPLFTLETKSPIRHFDFLGFTMQYEMSYTNVLNMIDLAGIPVFSRDRDDTHPLIIAGGPCVYNSEPISEFVDVVVVGEAEEVILEIIEVYKAYKGEGRRNVLRKLAAVNGVYIPSLYRVEYNNDGTVKKMIPEDESVPEKIKKNYVEDLDKSYFPKEFIVPYLQTVHDRVTLELFRGCTRGCRFCQAGMIYRPIREKSPERLLKDASRLIESTGYDEVSLSSLSSTDYSQLEVLIDGLLDRFQDKNVSVSLPSLRIDTFSVDLAEKLQTVRKSGLTFAPEAGTQRLRDVINKGVNEGDLFNAVSKAFEAGWGHIKLYFMIGLPTETMDDIEGIAVLAEKVLEKYYETESSRKNKNVKIVVSTSSFVPKAFTPFQWEVQDSSDEIVEKQKYLKTRLKNRKIVYNWHEPGLSTLEGVFARGDRRLGMVLYEAWKSGCKFDGWRDHFKYDKWMKAFEKSGIDPEFYTRRKRKYDEVLPWDIIDPGVSKQFLIRERQKAYRVETTSHCKNTCHNCGIAEFSGGLVCNGNS